MTHPLDAVLRAAQAEGLLPPEATVPHIETRPWPVVLLTALGAWLAALPLFSVIGLLLGDLAARGAGTYAVGALLLAGAVVVLRRPEVPVFLEQLAIPALLSGAGALAFALARDLPDQAAAAVLTPVATPGNLMVMAPAGLQFGDYWKFGLPIGLVFFGVAVLLVPVMLVALAVRLTSPGPALYWSDRVGRHNRIFRMPKFRSMRIDTPAVATHLLENPAQWLTPIGPFLRKSSLDELPQLWSILRGDMSFVGPRPALFNQNDLIALRTEAGVHELVPGLTGWAQVNGRDEIPIPQKVALDAEYLRRRSLAFDVRILWLTAIKVLRRDGVSH